MDIKVVITINCYDQQDFDRILRLMSEKVIPLDVHLCPYTRDVIDTNNVKIGTMEVTDSSPPA